MTEPTAREVVPDKDTSKPTLSEQHARIRSEAISLIRARTIARMSHLASAETSPVKTDAETEEAPRSSSPGRSPGESSPGRAPESSPKRSDQLFENPIPDFKPDTGHDMSEKQDDQSEHSLSFSPSEPGLQADSYESSGQAFPSQAMSMATPPVLAPSDNLLVQYGSNVQLTDVFTVAQSECTGSERSPDSLDQTYSLSEQGSPELSSVQQQSVNNDGLASSLPTIPEAQVDTKEQDFSPTKSDSVSAYGSTQSSPSTRSGVFRQKPPGFFWQLDSHGFPCSATDCDKRCNLWDGRSVICPKCGPFSETRYCSREHLLGDVKSHWAFCGQLAFAHPCHEDSIPRNVRDGPPLVPCLLQCDTPERHRQAVYFNACKDLGDYFIFLDPIDTSLDKRCSSRIFYTVVFEDPVEKDRFRRVLAACLFFTIEVVDLVDYMYRLLRDNLRAKSLWTNELDIALKHQLAKELSVHIQPHISGTRHACSTDWDGSNRRACDNTVCRGEYRRILGKLGGMGHQRLVEYLESGYWVLRAVRTTHPVVKSVEKRMVGVGFEDVLEEDQRKFSWGVGWEGAGSGEMEIESA